MRSVTQLGKFWKSLTNNLLTKVAQISVDVLGFFERHYYEVKNTVTIFLVNFLKILGYFLFQLLVALAVRKCFARLWRLKIYSNCRKLKKRFFIAQKCAFLFENAIIKCLLFNKVHFRHPFISFCLFNSLQQKCSLEDEINWVPSVIQVQMWL